MVIVQERNGNYIVAQHFFDWKDIRPEQTWQDSTCCEVVIIHVTEELVTYKKRHNGQLVQKAPFDFQVRYCMCVPVSPYQEYYKWPPKNWNPSSHP